MIRGEIEHFGLWRCVLSLVAVTAATLLLLACLTIGAWTIILWALGVT